MIAITLYRLIMATFRTSLLMKYAVPLWIACTVPSACGMGPYADGSFGKELMNFKKS